MTKKEQELQQRLLDLLEANNKVLEQVFELLTKLANPLHNVVPITPRPVEDIQKVAEEIEQAADEEPEDNQITDAETEITPEYCRKALKAITAWTSPKEAKTFLAKFGGAKTIPQLEKKYYGEFIAGAEKFKPREEN